MNCIYHNHLPCRLVNDTDRMACLLSGEWFDRPQVNNQKGNSDAIRKLLLHEEKQREKPEHKRCERGGQQTVLVQKDEADGVRDGNDSRSQKRGLSNEDGQKADEKGKVLKKKRGRPPKKVG